MKLESGMKVKLKPLDKIERPDPSIVRPMKPHFGKVVTIDIFSDDECFTIKELPDYLWNKDWIESTNLLPEHLFKI